MTGAAHNGLWEPEQCAAYLNMSVCWVYRWAAKGKLPHRKMGKALRFDPTEVAEWVKTQPGKSLWEALE